MGEARRAREIMLDTSGGLEGSRWGYTAACEVLTRAELALGDRDAAERWARKAEDTTRGGQLRIETAVARRATAAVALARGDAAESAAIALDGAARADGASAPVEAGRCRILAAKALVQAGRRADAIAELAHAAGQLGRVGAHGYRSQAEDALLRLGGRARRRTSVVARPEDGLRSLTEREREVAELVRRGHTNREIATAIFISEKTVERHLSRIFAKLGLSRRTELALQVASEGEQHTLTERDDLTRR
jgi:DNA-binding CsgD family transcriptional regulator